jgi:twitching motility protein PilT
MSTAAAPAPSSTANPGSATTMAAALVTAMLQSHPKASDLIFSPGRMPQVEGSRGLITPPCEGLRVLTQKDTERLAAELIADHRVAAKSLKNEEGSADLSYSIPQVARFRVNIFRQRGSYAIVLRVISPNIPSAEQLGLPEELKKIAQLKSGAVLVTGPTGSGKSSTLAAIIDLINSTRSDHILTIEDPIEFVHPHKKGTIHQRELHTDTVSFASALRAALRQAPKVILVGEMRDKETIEIALSAAETGHLVLSTLHTIDASKTVERIVGAFPLSEQGAIRTRLAATFRYFVAQKLIPRKDRQGRIAVFEVLKSTLRTRSYLEQGEKEGKTLLDAIKDGDQEGMQCFDAELEKLVRAGKIELNTALQYATNEGNLRLALADYAEEPAADAERPAVEPMMPAATTEASLTSQSAG